MGCSFSHSTITSSSSDDKSLLVTSLLFQFNRAVSWVHAASNRLSGDVRALSGVDEGLATLVAVRMQYERGKDARDVLRTPSGRAERHKPGR
ncbi:hypothetical protein DPMN_133525 [Dreissena polymorpha]|uniref:Uncharacterized protein n=1 Tax=Dreissena polymorpha TaxID=45954 RepID=A0A9D4FY27_DREPO|nr:hypothetical protein DPMN_133525 [Dreissena polymorpha]